MRKKIQSLFKVLKKNQQILKNVVCVTFHCPICNCSNNPSTSKENSTALKQMGISKISEKRWQDFLLGNKKKTPSVKSVTDSSGNFRSKTAAEVKLHLNVNLHIADLDELIGPVPYKRFYFKSLGKSNDQNSLKPHPEGGLCIKRENFTTSGLFHNFPKQSACYLSLSSGSTLSMWWNRILRNSSGSAGRQVLQYLIWSNFCVAADNTDGFSESTWKLLVFRKNINVD